MTTQAADSRAIASGFAAMAELVSPFQRMTEQLGQAQASFNKTLAPLQGLSEQITKQAELLSAFAQQPAAGAAAKELRTLARRNAALTGDLIRFLERVPLHLGSLTIGALQGNAFSLATLQRKASNGDPLAAEALALCEGIRAHVAAVVVALAVACAIAAANTQPHIDALTKREQLTGCLDRNAPPLTPLCVTGALQALGHPITFPRMEGTLNTS